MKDQNDIFFEEALNDDWRKGSNLIEVELSNKPFLYTAILILILGLVIISRLIFLNVVRGENFKELAEINSGKKEFIIPPRGLIYDRFGKILAQNKLSYEAVLDLNELLKNKEDIDKILREIEKTLNVPQNNLFQIINERINLNIKDLIILKTNLLPDEVIALKTKIIPAVYVVEGYQRFYPQGEIFSSVIGYVGLPSQDDLEAKKYLTFQSFTGKTGIEYQYDEDLNGVMGVVLNKRDALGNIIVKTTIQQPQPGKDIYLTIDAEFQTYLFYRMQQGLKELNRNSGTAVALNPKTGEILALISFPVYDNNIFINPSQRKDVLNLLKDKSLPLFNRAISGMYAPGSTIKPLVGIAALKENIIVPQKEIFSPGYLDVSNPYNPESPSRFLDWRYQGWVNLYSAIAQSSNVYFYIVGGGFDDIKGLGINKLIEWWKKFGLGSKTNIDLPGEAEGFLPNPQWHKQKFKKLWLLGDTYNVSIGQGDLKVTPLQLINYISAIANGGKIYKPFVLKDNHPQILYDLSYLKNEIEEVKKGMILTIESPEGTAHLMADLPFKVAGKTGTAQIGKNKLENAFFVGFAPVDDPQIALLILVENSKQGSLNAVPIAKDVLNWYYQNKIKK